MGELSKCGVGEMGIPHVEASGSLASNIYFLQYLLLSLALDVLK